MKDWNKEIENKFPNVIVKSKISGYLDKVEMECRLDGHVFISSPKNITRTVKGCPKCSNKIRYTEEEFLREAKKRNDKINVIGKFISCRDQIKCQCKKCENIYYTSGSVVLNGFGCKVCSDKVNGLKSRKTKEIFQKELDEISKNEFKVLGDYFDRHTKVDIFHNKCKRKFKASPSTILKRTACYWCEKRIKIKDNEIHSLEVKEHTNGNFILVGDYINSTTATKYKHIECGEVFTRNPNFFLGKEVRCPICQPKSVGEIKVAEILNSLDVNFIQQKTFDDLKIVRKLKFDFYIESINSCIEYDGIQHYELVEAFGGIEGFEETKRRDEIKNKYCKNNSINLLRIPYYEKDIEGTIKSFIEKVSVQYV